MFKLIETTLDSVALVDAVVTPEAGAVVTFEGRVRDRNNDREVTSLTYTAYPELAERVARKIRKEARETFEIRDVAIVQRLGNLSVTECSIRIAVSAAHRRAAFEAGEWIIDEIKKRLPVWKKEQYADGSEAWINRPERSENNTISASFQVSRGCCDDFQNSGNLVQDLLVKKAETRSQNVNSFEEE